MILTTVLILAHFCSFVLSSNCYNCQNFEFEHELYDPDCDSDQYSGHTISCLEGHNCFTDVYDDGRLHRGCEYVAIGLQCIKHKYPHSTQCFCDGELCNIGVCAECIGDVTIPPTIDVTTPTPDTSNPAPDVTTPTPDISNPTPDVTTPTPDISNPTPDVTTPTSDISNPTPDVTTPTPDISNPTADVTTPTPDISNPTPDVTTPTPDISNPTPDVTTPTPDITTSTHETTTPTPDVTSPTPDVITTTPEVITPTPVASTSTPEISSTTTKPAIFDITCYDCQNGHPEWADSFDETCSELGYDGMTYACDNCGSCFTEIHDDGSMVRGEAGGFTDECAYGEDYIACYCTEDLCNNVNCDQC